MDTQDLDRFAAEVRRLRGRGEPPLYPAFKQLLESAYTTDSFEVDTQLRAPGAGFPDLTVSRGPRLVNWIEVKAPDVSVDPLPDADATRFGHYLDNLPHIVLTNGWMWRLFAGGSEVERVEVNPDWLRGERQLTSNEVGSLSRFLDKLQALPPASAPSYEHAVELLACAARIVFHALADLTEDTMPSPLADAREAMTDLLRTNPSDPTEIALDRFADTLAQLVTFGYLLARVEAGHDVDPVDAADALDSAEHPFLKRTLYAVWDPELESTLRGPLRTAADAVNAAAPQLRGPDGSWRRVPYVYEQFFAAFKPEDRFRYGVFYTPEEITRFQVRQVQRLLRDEFGLSGLLDPAVRFLDPACGTGTYLLALAEEAVEEAADQGLPTGAALRELFSERVVGFEVLPGPAVVAQARLIARLRAEGVHLGQRFPVFVVNSLAPPASGDRRQGGSLWADNIGDEQAAGDHVKRNQPIMVCLGNPPWGSRPRATFQTGLADESNLVSEWAAGSSAAVINLYDLYVAFWRLAFDLLLARPEVQPPQGIVSYITNRSWIYGRAYSGMRKWLRNRDVAGELVDLGGDVRAGARRDDEPVFDIQAGSAIGTLVFGGRSNKNDEPLRYYRMWGNRQKKISHLADDELPTPELVHGKGGDWFGPVDWGPLTDAPSLKEIFTVRFPGVKTHRDDLVIDVDRDRLLERLRAWNAADDQQRLEQFGPSSTYATPPSRGYEIDEQLVQRHRYRPLDDRWLYGDRRFIDRPGSVSKIYAAREDVEALLILDTRTTEGPAVIAANALPGYNSFRGSYETHVFPIVPTTGPDGFRMTGGGDEMDLTEDELMPQAVRGWAAGHGAQARDVGAYILALANAPSYVETFSEALSVETVRFPLIEDDQIFWDAVEVGHQLLDAWCLRCDPIGTWRQQSSAELGAAEIGPTSIVFENGDRLDDLPVDVSELVVSRWPVMQRFLEARADLRLTVELGREVQRVAGAISVIVAARSVCDELLERAIAGRVAPPAQIAAEGRERPSAYRDPRS